MYALWHHIIMIIAKTAKEYMERLIINTENTSLLYHEYYLVRRILIIYKKHFLSNSANLLNYKIIFFICKNKFVK